MPAERALLTLALATVLLGAGCIGAPTAPGAGETGVSDEAATNRALAAEERYIASALSNADCVDSWGTAPTITQKEATVVERGGEGVLVEVQHPFSYSTETTTEDGRNESIHADGATEATYRVTADGTERVSGTGLSPC
mgnify:CR=1 FL=1